MDDRGIGILLGSNGRDSPCTLDPIHCRTPMLREATTGYIGPLTVGSGLGESMRVSRETSPHHLEELTFMAHAIGVDDPTGISIEDDSEVTAIRMSPFWTKAHFDSLTTPTEFTAEPLDSPLIPAAMSCPRLADGAGAVSISSADSLNEVILAPAPVRRRGKRRNESPLQSSSKQFEPDFDSSMTVVPGFVFDGGHGETQSTPEPLPEHNHEILKTSPICRELLYETEGPSRNSCSSDITLMTPTASTESRFGTSKDEDTSNQHKSDTKRAVVNLKNRRSKQRSQKTTNEQRQQALLKAEKSKLSARECRKRKKLYILSLEKQVKECEIRHEKESAKIEALRAAVAKAKRYIDRLVTNRH